MPIAQTIPASHTLLALLLGLTAAAANILGGVFILRREWSRQYLKSFLALGAGFMVEWEQCLFFRAGGIFHRSFFRA